LQHGRSLQTLPIEYTLDADFDKGSLVNVNYKDVHNQLQLNGKPTPFNFVWAGCLTRGTIVKVDTINGTVLGEYRSAPDNVVPGPQRAAVDQDGSVWWANWGFSNWDNPGPNGLGTIVHIGLKENNQCEDRNKNGVIDTSTGLGDIRPWPSAMAADAKDECIVHHTEVNSLPGHVSIDKDNNVWVGGRQTQNFDLIKGGRWDVPGSGTIIRSEPSVGFGGFSGLMDKNGTIW
jgi:hypothetical protein